MWAFGPYSLCKLHSLSLCLHRRWDVDLPENRGTPGTCYIVRKDSLVRESTKYVLSGFFFLSYV
jgi:hypothetical protein